MNTHLNDGLGDYNLLDYRHDGQTERGGGISGGRRGGRGEVRGRRERELLALGARRRGWQMPGPRSRSTRQKHDPSFLSVAIATKDSKHGAYKV